jgi:pimeloyl-ACP methyl ester carboxylesterase
MLIPGGADVELYVEETGNPTGRPVLFIHGISQCGLAWSRQLHSELGGHLRLVSMDLRGHGRSERPSDGYDDPMLWADDIHAVITELELDQPILCGWSYAGVVIGDYLQAYGEHLIGGLSLIAAVSGLGETLLPHLGSDFVATFPGLFSEDVATSSAALQTFVRITTEAEMMPADLYRVLGYNGIVAPGARRQMMNRTLSHDALLGRLTTPVLITHGLADKIVLPAMSEHLTRLMPHAKASYYRGIGHSPFIEDTARFNAELVAFASSL